MNYIEFVKKLHRDVHDSVDRKILTRLGRALDRSGSMGKLLQDIEPSLQPFAPTHIVALSDAYDAFTVWKEAATALRRELALSKLSLPDGSLEFTFTAAQLSALGRAARMCPRASFPDHESWKAGIKAHVDLWDAAISLSLDSGYVAISFTDPSHPEAEEFQELVTAKAEVKELLGYRWLGARRGEKAELLKIEITLPWNDIRDQARSRIKQMGLPAQKRGIDSIVDELIENDLQTAVRVIIDRDATKAAIASCRNAYTSLIDAPAIGADKIMSIYVPDNNKPLGVAILTNEGVVEQTQVLDNNDGTLDKLLAIAEENEVTAIVLPVSKSQGELLRGVEQKLGLYNIEYCPTAGLADARGEYEYDKPVASAVVLGTRMLNPLEEWSKMDPVKLGLGEYPREINPELLKPALEEARALTRWKRTVSGTMRDGASPESARSGGALASKGLLNPMVKSIRDLRPGMQVHGVVTNLTGFGAFVNIGLATEAMVHVSQLSDDFVDDPAKVLRVGQKIEARVIEVIPEKKRIGLTMKTPAADRSFDDMNKAPRSGGGGGGRGRPGEEKSKNAALADLDALFKK